LKKTVGEKIMSDPVSPRAQDLYRGFSVYATLPAAHHQQLCLLSFSFILQNRSGGISSSGGSNVPLRQNNAVNNNNYEPFLQRWIGVVTLVLRILLWPLRRASQWVFPVGDLDGLSAPVTAKAAQQFVTYLRNLHSGTNAEGISLTEPWVTTGFAAVQAQVAQSSSIVLVYLHSPLHRNASKYCQSVLLGNNMSNFLRQPNLICLGVSIHTAQGAQLASMLSASSFPCLALLQPKNVGSTSSNSSNAAATMNLVFKAEGPVLLSLRSEQLVNYLNMTLQRHQIVLAEQEARRIQREQESELRRQQDEEYEAALLADQERERQQQEERDQERRRLEEEEAKERAKKQEEENRLGQAKALLRPAPEKGGTRIRFTLPTGAKLDRRFHNDETIKSLKAFLTLHFSEQTDDTQHIKNIGLSTSFPKKTYHELDDQTLEESGLSPQAVLMVQDLDA
jgi:FAS-associated factor 2